MTATQPLSRQEKEYQRGFIDALWQYYNFTNCSLSKFQGFFERMELDKAKFKDQVNALQNQRDDYDIDFVEFFND